jgi:aminotransferase
MNLDTTWRERVSERTGGKTFDAPGGGYAFSDVLAEERQLALANKPGDPGSALLTLSIADPTWKMRPEAMDAGRRFYEESADATRYTDNAGIRAGGSFPNTHEAIADYLNRRYGTALTADWVQYSPGSIKRALAEYIPALLFDADTTLIFPTPGYPVIKSPINRHEARYLDVPMRYDGKRWSLSLNGDLPSGKRVVYANLPHNPTGSGATREEWTALLDWARSRGAILVVDEAYVDLRYNPDITSVLTIPGWEECCVVLQSVSKGWNATGLRFGWVAGHPTVVKAIRKVMDVKDSGMFGPSIAAGLTCLQHPEWAEETRRRYENLHRLLFDGLRSAGFRTVMPDAGLCQFTPAPKSADGTAFADAVACGQWFRKELRVSLMHYTVAGETWLRWAVTLKPVPECDLPDEAAVIHEVANRLNRVRLAF